MAWIAPKVDWVGTDKINYADFNRIENNILELRNYLQSIQYTMPPISDNNSSLYFDGVIGTYASVPQSPIGTTNFTAEAWVKPNAVNVRQGVFSTRKNNAAGSWQMEIGAGLGGVGRLTATGIGTFIIDSVDNVITAGVWQHISYVRNGGSDTLLVNGFPVAISSTAAYTVIENTDDRTIGATSPTVQPFNGAIDEVRVWNFSRTQAQIQASMYTTLLGNETGLVGYWKCGDGSGTTLTAATGNNGTLVGGASWTTDKPYSGTNMTRTMYSIDYLSSINRIENNLDSIRVAFMSPADYLPKKTWTLGLGFDYTDATRLESNTNRLLSLGMNVYLSYRKCGAYTCGDTGALY